MNKIEIYLKAVCDQIRSKKTHNTISKELKTHIDEQIETFIKTGMDKETATDKAIEEMGDPITVGLELDRIHKAKPDFILIFLTIIMCLTGLSFTYLIYSEPEFIQYLEKGGFGEPNYIANLSYIIVGAIFLILAYLLDYTVIGKYPNLILILFSLFFVSYNYITISATFDNLILLFILIYAGILYSLRDKKYLGVILSGFYFCFYLLITRTFGRWYYVHLYVNLISCFILITVAIIKNFFGGKKIIELLIVYIPTIFITPYVFSDYRLDKLKAALNPDIYKDGIGYQLFHQRNLIKNSKLLGSSDFPPIAPSDNLLLTYIIAKFGLLVGIVIIAVFLVMIIRMFKIVFNQKSMLGFIVSFAISTSFLVQGLLYINANLGIIYIGGSETIPFFRGGINLIANMILMGIFLSVFRNNDFIRDKVATPTKSIFEFKNGKLTIDFNSILKPNLKKE